MDSFSMDEAIEPSNRPCHNLLGFALPFPAIIHSRPEALLLSTIVVKRGIKFGCLFA